MFRFSHRSLIVFSGIIWFMVGIYLLPLGLRLIHQSGNEGVPLIGLMAPHYMSFDNAVVVLIAIGMIIGALKGRTVMAKSVNRVVQRISSLPEPSPIYQVYSLPYFLLIGCMICLGISLKFFNTPSDIRGVIDIAVGTAMLNGSILYFRQAFNLKSSGCDRIVR